jgi:hypothetical protein
MTGADKRGSPRFAVQLTAEIVAAGGRVHRGESRNLSRTGLCLEIVEALVTGDDVVVRVTLMFDDDRSSEPLELPARVVWCTSFGDAHQVGTQFRPMTEDRATYLDMFLRYLEQQAASGPDGDDGRGDEGDEGDEDDPFTA